MSLPAVLGGPCVVRVQFERAVEVGEGVQAAEGFAAFGVCPGVRGVEADRLGVVGFGEFVFAPQSA
ncbi:hypothetical protein KDK95_26985 [Actinospica sp. MGRD01-02]|uniref:Uncharacterized protein n=1 Tax=Actinospica acidithermotolerans TaxID=2828514 RepID=A0A941ILG4_9ACTN|nr:hypothetical protein [Actinospica acidithermotolerans]MBR7829977.1 hypothetical protein [Actinospica acidithermotolerans]